MPRDGGQGDLADKMSAKLTVFGARFKTACPSTKSKLFDQGRGNRGGGGSGGNLPPQLRSCGALPSQLWTVNVVHFYFCLFLHMNFGLSQKIVGQTRGVFSFG